MVGYVALSLAIFVVGFIVSYSIVYVLGFVLVDVVVSDRLFNEGLFYIRDHGCGHDKDANAEIFRGTRITRRRAILRVTYIIGTILALVLAAVIIFCPLQRCSNDLMRVILIFISILGVPIGIYKASMGVFDSEKRAKMLVGRLIYKDEERKTALFEYEDDGSQFRHQEDFSDSVELFDDLEENREYYINCYYRGDSKWRTCIGPTDRSQWGEEAEW